MFQKSRWGGWGGARSTASEAKNVGSKNNFLKIFYFFYFLFTFANIRTPAEDEKSSENYDYYGFLLKSIELQLGALFLVYIETF